MDHTYRGGSIMASDKLNFDQSNSYLLFSTVVFIAYFFVLSCIIVSALSVTHEDILYENYVTLSFTSVKVPIKVFFTISTTVVVLLFFAIHLILQKKISIDNSFIIYVNKKIYKITILNHFVDYVNFLLQNKKNHLVFIFPLFLILLLFTFAVIHILIYSILPYHSAAITYYQKFLLLICAYIAFKMWKNILVDVRKSFLYLISNCITTLTITICIFAPFLMLTLPNEDKFLYDCGFAVRGQYNIVVENGALLKTPLSKQFTPAWFEPINKFLSAIGFVSAYASIPRNLDLSGKTIAFDLNYRDSINNILTTFNKHDDQIAKYTTIKPAKILFQGRDLQGANFSNAILCNAEFDRINLSRANFLNAKFYNTFFINSILSHTSFQSVYGRGLRFWNINLSYSIFDDAKLQGASFNNCDMTFSEFQEADLTAADIFSSDVIAVDFNKSVLNGAVFVNSLLDGCIFRRAHMSGTLLRCKNLIACDLRAIIYDDTTTQAIREKFFHEYNENVLTEKKNTIEDHIGKSKTEAIPIGCIYENVPQGWNFPKSNLSLFDYAVRKSEINIRASCRYPEEISEIFMTFTMDDTEGMDIIETKKRELLTHVNVMQKFTCGKNPLPVYTVLQLAETAEGLKSLLTKNIENIQ